MTSPVRKIVFAASIAAVYAVMTIVLMPISYGMIQFRVSEVLTILPYFIPVAVPGLFVGCIIANMFNPSGIILADMIIGGSATLIAALITMQIGKSRRNEEVKTKAIALIPPVLINAVFIGAMIAYFMVGAGEAANFWVIFPECALFVGFGQLAVIYILGLPLMIYLPRMGVIDRMKKIYEGQSSNNKENNNEEKQ